MTASTQLSSNLLYIKDGGFKLGSIHIFNIFEAKFMIKTY